MPFLRFTWAYFDNFRYFGYLFYPVAKSRSRYPTFLYSDLRSIHMVGSYGHFNFGQKFILCQKKKKKSSAHSFSPFALMIDPSKENWGSAVYFLFLCEKIPKITELQVKSSQELLPGIHEAEHKQKTQGPAHRVSGLCECMRCSSSLKAAWAECTCAGAARYIVRAWALLDICKRTVF